MSTEQPSRHELQRDGKHPAPCAKFCEATAFNAEIRRLRRLLDEAADSIASWGAYASEYFQEKHDLAGDIKRFRAEGMERRVRRDDWRNCNGRRMPDGNG